MKMQTMLLCLLVGGGLGAALGYYGKCTSGTCPLTATWWRGAIYGAVLGLLFYSAQAGNAGGKANQATSNVKHVTESEFESAVIQSTGPAVVDFYATWCGPCKTLAPMLNELAAPLTNQVRFVKVDIDQSGKLAERFGVEAVPTLVFFRDGKVVDRVVGVPAKGTLQGKLNALAADAKGNVGKP